MIVDRRKHGENPISKGSKEQKVSLLLCYYWKMLKPFLMRSKEPSFMGKNGVDGIDERDIYIYLIYLYITQPPLSRPMTVINGLLFKFMLSDAFAFDPFSNINANSCTFPAKNFAN